jgi:hypothetical protein
LDDLIGALILAAIYGAAGRWVVADPAPMIFAAGLGAALLSDAPSRGGERSVRVLLSP